jgi:HEAT repeat protein
MHRILLLGTALVLLGLCQSQPRFAAAGDPKQPKADLQKVLANLKSKDDNVKLDAMMQIVDFGPKAEAAVPDLIAALQSSNEDFRLNSAIALGRIGKAAVPALAKLLPGKDADIRYYVLWALGWIGPDAKDTAPEVVKALADKNDGVRRKAAFALGRIAPGAKEALPALIGAFDDANEDVRAAASEAVGRFGADAVPALVGALKEKKVPRSVQAARALGEMGSDAKDAVPALKAMLYEEGDWQTEAAEALAKVGKAAIPVLVEATKDAKASTRAAGIAGLGKAGAEAVPDLVDALGNKHADVRRGAAKLLEPMRVNDKMVVLGFAYALKDEDEMVRYHCAHGLMNLGALAKPAAAKLYEALTDLNFHVRMFAYQALAQMSEDPNTRLKKLIQDKKAEVRIPAASLYVMMTGGNDGVQVLVDGLKEKDLNLRMQCAYVLAQRGQERKAILPTLMEALKSKSPGVREQAIQSFQNIGGDGKDAAPALLEILQNDPEPNLKQQALYALQNVGGDPKLMLPGLKKMIEDKDASLRLTALQIIWRYGPDAIELIVKCFDDKDENVRQNATWVLQQVQGDLKPALPKIRELVKSKNQQVRIGAVALLSRCGDDAADDLLALLKNGDDQVRWQAVYGLRNMQKSAKKLLPTLTAMVKDEKNNDTRAFAAQAMAQLGPDAMPTLFELLKNEKEESVKAAAIQGLWTAGQVPKEAIPYLIEALKDKGVQVRSNACTALGQIGQDKEAKKAIPALAEVVQKDKEQNVRHQAIYALGSMAPDSLPAMAGCLKVDDANVRMVVLNYLSSYNHHKKEAVPGLILCLKDGNANVRQQACYALGQIGKDAVDALEPLNMLLKDTNPNVQSAAQNAINQIGPKKKDEKKDKSK